jgi:hypothetical protein
MPAKRMCAPGCNREAVNVGTSSGEFLTYEVQCRPAALFDLVDQDKTVILSSTDPPVSPGQFAQRWPQPGGAAPIGHHTHTLGLQFLPAVEYRYKVSHCAGDGTVITVLKDCTYTRSDQTDSFFDALDIDAF